MLSTDWITQDYYFISLILILDQGFLLLSVMVQVTIQEERDAGERKREADLQPDGFEPCRVEANAGQHMQKTSLF